jgi:dihydrolipoamide dehydrogenase
MEYFDALIIGSGQGGTPLAKKLAQANWKVALIERKWVGGTCVNYGCTPTKTMIASAKTAYTVAQAEKYGVQVPEFKVNYPAIIDRKDAVVEQFRSGSRSGLEQTENLTLIYGEASFVNTKEIAVKENAGSTRTLRGGKIFIDAGTSPAVPEIPGLAEAGYFTSTTLMDLKELPAHLIIIGGGYIGLEFGQMYRRFGSQVTILQHSERLLRREDAEISAEVEKFLRAENIQIYTQAKTLRVEKKKDQLFLSLKINGEPTTITGSHLLLATGQVPNTAGLNLAAANIATNKKGFIRVNEKLETTAPDIYALGDIKGGPAFTHISYNDYLVLYHNLVEQKNLTIANRPVPYCVFTDPQVARVGITETEAREQKLNIKIAKLPMNKVARAIETGQTQGLIKAIVAADSGQILGATVVGAEGGEIMSLLQMAMAGNIPYMQLREMIFAHPLYAEALNNLFMTLQDPV